MKQFMIFWKRSDLKMYKCFVVISYNASVQNNGKRGLHDKGFIPRAILKMFIGASTYFGVAWDRFELCGVFF